MAAGGDQPQQMREWIKEVERAGYVVDSDKLLFKIRHPKTGGLIMTAPQFPRGNQVLRDTMKRAKQRGIIIPEPIKKHAGGQPPPPVWGEVIERVEVKAVEQDGDTGEVEEIEEAEEVPANRRGPKPATPEKKAVTAAIRERMLARLEEAGGNTHANRMALFHHGRNLAIRENRKVIGAGAKEPMRAAEDHMRKIIDGTRKALWTWAEQFWIRCFDDLDALDNVGAGPKEEKVTETITPQGEETIESLREANFHLRESIDALREDKDALTLELDEAKDSIANLRGLLADKESELAKAPAVDEEMQKAQMQQQADALARAVDELGETKKELALAQRKLQEAPAKGAAMPVGDELSVIVLRRMLLLAYPDGEATINDAIEFATEVVRRTSP